MTTPADATPSIPGSTGRFPDFVIGGAPKCGTTSVHFILNQHPEIGLPDEEIHYFDADDPLPHPDFFSVDKSELDWFDARPSHKANLEWYRSRFAPLNDMPLIGEDSTTYLFSAVAPQRMKDLLPDAKLIFLLRDPVKRAYSQYWHLMCSGRLTCSFEKALFRHTSMMLGSTYTPHLQRYFDLFGRDQVKVVIFEDFISEQQAQIDSITDYLGTSRMDLKTAETWFNQTHYPTHPKTQQYLNMIGSRIVSRRYRNHMGQATGLMHKINHKIHYRWFRDINPILLKASSPPPMREATRAYLAQHFSARNSGLSELLGRKMSDVWRDFHG